MRRVIFLFCSLLAVVSEAKPLAKTPYNVRLYMPDVVYEEAVTFELNKETIKKSSFEALDKLAKILQEDTSLSFEVVIYREKPSGAGYSKHLTKERAKEVIEYLVKEGGVDASRLGIAWYEDRCSLKSKEKADTRLIDFVIKRDDLNGCRPYKAKR